MRFGRSRWHWYELIILGLAAAIIYPDKVLEWISDHTGWASGWLQLLLVEVAAVASLVSAMALLMPAYPQLDWWEPLVFIGVLGVIRVIMWFVTEMFDFGD